jgi:hypothetical protein
MLREGVALSVGNFQSSIDFKKNFSKVLNLKELFPLGTKYSMINFAELSRKSFER